MNKYFGYIFILFFTFCHAQNNINQMHVVDNGEFVSGELVAKEIVDANGEVCAGLIISTDLTSLAFSSYNGIVKTNEQPGKYFLFLSPSERVVEVYKTGYKSLKIILGEHGVNLQSGKVWQIEITDDAPKLDLFPVNILVNNVEGVEVTIDGEYIGKEKVFQLSPGKHTIGLSKTGYKTITEEIEVTETSTLFNFDLHLLELKTVTLRSVPTQAKLYIDGAEEGQTDNQIFRHPGTYKLRLVKTGFLDVQEEITITEDGENIFIYNLNKNSSTLTLDITPFDAEVLINKKSYINNKSIELVPGSYQIEISKDSYKSLKDYFEITLDNQLVKTYNLKQLTGSLQFKVIPIDAEVKLKLNGKIIENWKGAKIIRDIPVGEYVIECKHEEFETLSRNIIITENKTTLEEITLNKSSISEFASYTSQALNAAIFKLYYGNEMVLVKGGSFNMGCDTCEVDGSPVHRVTVSDFYIGKYEVTQKIWKEVMGNNPSHFKGDNLPIENVSWNDVQEFIGKLNQKTGENYRLPTEAEWEYASRGGNQSRGYNYSGSNNLDQVGCYRGNSGSKTHLVGTRTPNELGINDMSGNVWEWCSDWYDENYYSRSSSNNPKGPESGNYRVLRGGSWAGFDNGCRVAIRNWFSPGIGNFNYGFRLAMDSTEKIKLEKISTTELEHSNNQPINSPGLPEMVFVKGDTFEMGSDYGERDEKPIHSVKVSDFYLGKYEVTNEHYCKFLNEKGNQVEDGANWIEINDTDCKIIKLNGVYVPIKGYENHPVVEVTWYGANAFCIWAGGRLPTEAEWEYAAKGGSKSEGYRFSGSDYLEEVSWSIQNSSGKTQPVGQKYSNELYIFDMSGNVREWCSDWYDINYYINSPKNNPQGPGIGIFKVLRGGSIESDENNCIITSRGQSPANISNNISGFRVAKSAE